MLCKRLSLYLSGRTVLVEVAACFGVEARCNCRKYTNELLHKSPRGILFVARLRPDSEHPMPEPYCHLLCNLSLGPHTPATSACMCSACNWERRPKAHQHSTALPSQGCGCACRSSAPCAPATHASPIAASGDLPRPFHSHRVQAPHGRCSRSSTHSRQVASTHLLATMAQHPSDGCCSAPISPRAVPAASSTDSSELARQTLQSCRPSRTAAWWAPSRCRCAPTPGPSSRASSPPTALPTSPTSLWMPSSAGGWLGALGGGTIAC
jgi:hypothetical protein